MRKNPWLPKDIVQPKQAKIGELRDMMKDISLDHLDTRLPDDDWTLDIDLTEDSILDIDAEGNMIPDF